MLINNFKIENRRNIFIDRESLLIKAKKKRKDHANVESILKFISKVTYHSKKSYHNRTCVFISKPSADRGHFKFTLHVNLSYIEVFY